MKFKKLLPIILLSLTSCNKNEDKTLKIMCPTGAPSIALSFCSENPNFETTNDPSLLKGYFAAGNYDVIVAPTDVGIKAIKEGVDYKIAATITFGNFFLVSTGLDEDKNLSSDDTIVLFQQGGLPDKVFHYIYGNAFNDNITYVKNVAFAATAFENKTVTNQEGKTISVDYVLLAEPKLTALNVENLEIIDLSEEFYKKSETTKVYQASIFVKNESNVKSFLESAEEKISEMLDDASLIATYMNKVNDPQIFFGVPPQMAQKITEKNNGMSIGFIYAKNIEKQINDYIKILGMEEIDESYFY